MMSFEAAIFFFLEGSRGLQLHVDGPGKKLRASPKKRTTVQSLLDAKQFWILIQFFLFQGHFQEKQVGIVTC